MSETESSLTKYHQAKTLADKLGRPKGLSRLFETGRVMAFGDDAPDGAFNPGTDIVVKRTPLGRALEVTFFRLAPHTMSLRNHARRRGGVFSEDVKVTTFRANKK